MEERGSFEENSLLPSSEWSGDKDVTDYYLIKNHFDTLFNLYHLTIIEFWSCHSWFDKVELLTVDHPETLNIGTTFDEKILAWSVTKAPDFCVDNYGNNQLAKILYNDRDCYIGEKGDYLILGFIDIGEIPGWGGAIAFGSNGWPPVMPSSFYKNLVFNEPEGFLKRLYMQPKER